MKKATFSLVYNRKDRLNKDGKGLVEIYCYVEGRVKFIGTGISIYEDHWDKKKRRVSKDHPNETKLNIMLTRMLNKLEDYELTISNNKGEFTFEDLKSFSLNGESKKDNFIEWLKKEIEGDNTVAAGTRGYRLNMLNKLIEVAGNDLPLSRVNYELIKEFNNYLAKDLIQSTQSKLHNQLKKFITIAVHQGLIKKNPYDAFKVKRPVYDQKKVLWFDDLERLFNLQYPDDSSMETARLKFLFSCYTGLRISDNNALEWDFVRDKKLFVKMQKTVRPVVVPLNLLGDQAAIILHRAKMLYKDNIKVFPYMPDAVVNKKLKRIGIDAEIPFPLTFHTSRHTFCTMIAHKTGSVFEVMRYSGIQKVDTAMIYISLHKIYSL